MPNYCFLTNLFVLVLCQESEAIMGMRQEQLTGSLAKSFNSADTGYLVAKPELDVCPLCQTPLQLQACGKTAWIMSTKMQKIVVMRAVCTLCNQSYNYDGKKDAMLNYNNQFLLPQEVVLDYLYTYSTSGGAIKSWLRNLLRCNTTRFGTVDDVSSRRLLMQRGQFSQAFAGAAELLSFPPQAFKCCSHPKGITMDGTVISIRFERLPNFNAPWLREEKKVFFRATTRKERQLPELTTCESNLLSQILGSNERFPAYLQSLDDLPPLLALSSNLSSSFAQLLFLCSNILAMQEKIIPLTTPISLDAGAHPFAKFLSAKNAPLSTLIPKTSREAFFNILSNPVSLNVSDLRTLQNVAPVFWGFYHCLMYRFPSTSVVWQMLQNAVSWVQCIFSQLEKNVTTNHFKDLTAEETAAIYAKINNSHCPNPDLQELWDTGCYFPGFPIVRQLSSISINDKLDANCTKHAKHAGSLAPGIVLFYCLEHSKCIGFIVQKSPESPALIFETIVSRFKNIPETIVYDNGCNLFEYFNNRIPSLFSNTQIFIDNFHFNSHRGCAPTFDTHHNLFITKNINTSLCEQKNAKLSKSKKGAPLQRFRTFVAFFRFAVFKLNEDEI